MTVVVTVNDQPVVALVTSPADEAEAIARRLLEEKLAACVNIVDSVQALYWWDGAITADAEALLLIKTFDHHVMGVRQAVQKMISYETFELVVLSAQVANAPYLAWMQAVVGSRPPVVEDGTKVLEGGKKST